uniref:Uncharacterized protein n=1 Tax=Arundo donax TaxID=35708 RepID=A0A0A9GUV9_ARUDO
MSHSDKSLGSDLRPKLEIMSYYRICQLSKHSSTELVGIQMKIMQRLRNRIKEGGGVCYIEIQTSWILENHISRRKYSCQLIINLVCSINKPNFSTSRKHSVFT